MSADEKKIKRNSIYKKLVRRYEPSFFAIDNRIKQGVYWWRCGGYYSTNHPDWEKRQTRVLNMFRRDLEHTFDMDTNICADEVWNMSLVYNRNGIASLSRTLKQYISNVIFVNMIL